MSKWLCGVMIPLALIGLGVAVFQALGVQKPDQGSKDRSSELEKLRRIPILSVETILRRPPDLPIDVSCHGTVVPFRRLTVAAEVAARIEKKSDRCRLGKYVRKGEVLFELDSTDFALEVKRLESLRESEYAQQSELEQEVENAQRVLKLADEELAIHEKEVKRLESLPGGLASESEVDAARRVKIASENQKLGIQNQLQALAVKKTRIMLAEKLAATQLSQAQVNLQRTKVVAPIDGVIVSEQVEQDSYVSKGATLCSLEDTDKVEVSCNLKIDQLLSVLGQESSREPSATVVVRSSYELPPIPVTVSYGVPGRTDLVYSWSGIVSRYEGIGLDNKSRTVPIRILVDDPENVKCNGKPIGEASNGGLPALVNGMFVDVHIHTKPASELMLIPKVALQPGNSVLQFLPYGRAKIPSRPADSTSLPTAESEEVDSSEWVLGKIRVVNDVRVLRSIELNKEQLRVLGYSDGDLSTLLIKEFWVAEVGGDLIPGSQVVTSPMATLVGDGSDPGRYSLPQEVDTGERGTNDGLQEKESNAEVPPVGVGTAAEVPVENSENGVPK